MDYKDRMKVEYTGLKDKYDKLHKMLVKYDAGKLEFTPTCPIELLREQASVMGRYLYILEVRAVIEGVSLLAPVNYPEGLPLNHCEDLSSTRAVTNMGVTVNG